MPATPRLLNYVDDFVCTWASQRHHRSETRLSADGRAARTVPVMCLTGRSYGIHVMRPSTHFE